MQGVQVWSLVRELRSHMPSGRKKKKKRENRNNIITNLVKTLKMVHIKKAILKNRRVVFRFIAKLSRKYRVPIYLLSPHYRQPPTVAKSTPTRVIHSLRSKNLSWCIIIIPNPVHLSHVPSKQTERFWLPWLSGPEFRLLSFTHNISEGFLEGRGFQMDVADPILDPSADTWFSQPRQKLVFRQEIHTEGPILLQTVLMTTYPEEVMIALEIRFMPICVSG